MQSAQTQVRIAEEAADAKEVQGLSKILVMLLKRNPHITPFHIQTLVHKREVEGLRGDPALKAHLGSVLAAARERNDLSEGAQKLLQVAPLPHAGALGNLSGVQHCCADAAVYTMSLVESAVCCWGLTFVLRSSACRIRPLLPLS